jgi:DNA-binding CsgD family transcriptional regulator
MNPHDNDVYRPSDLALLRSAIREIAPKSGLRILFAGLVDGSDLTITEFLGTTTRSLKDLNVRPGEGIGGRALRQGRPIAVSDYLDSDSITHHHDDAVRIEGLRMMVALPILVESKVRGVLYAAHRDTASMGDRVTNHLVDGTVRIGRELEIRDEVDRRVAIIAAATNEPGEYSDHDLRNTVRVAHAELLSLAHTTDDAGLAGRILGVTAQLQGSAGVAPGGPRLTRRELDVLAQIGLGCSYPEAARRLSLRSVTVKSYMQSVMTKLGVHSRAEAVVLARRTRILP